MFTPRRSSNGRFRRARLRRRRKQKTAALLASAGSIACKKEQPESGQASPPPAAPGHSEPAIAWPTSTTTDPAKRVKKMQRPQLRQELDELGVPYDKRTGTPKLKALLTEALRGHRG